MTNVLLDRIQIVETILRFGWSLDVKEWELCRSCFTDELETDYSDFRGEPPRDTQRP